MRLRLRQEAKNSAHRERLKGARTSSTLFDEVDKDGDGELSKGELMDVAPAYFGITRVGR